MHSCPAKRRLSALNAMLSAIVHARGSGLRKWLTVQHISYVGGKLLRNRAILIKPATLEQRTPEPVLSFSRVHTIRRNLSVQSSRAWRSCRGHTPTLQGVSVFYKRHGR